MQCLILAGGLGTRMKPYTERAPKALIEVRGRPFLHYQLDALVAEGVEEVVLSIGFKGAMIRKSVGDGSVFGLRVRYVDEGSHLLGTGGALRKALDEGALSERFLVLYGDSFLPIRFRPVIDALEASLADAVMTVYRNHDRLDGSNVCYRDGRIEVYDKRPSPETAAKMDYIDYGLSAFARDVVAQRIEPGIKTDLADLLHRLSVEGRLQGFEVTERFYEIGSPEGLADFTELVERREEAARRSQLTAT